MMKPKILLLLLTHVILIQYQNFLHFQTIVLSLGIEKLHYCCSIFNHSMELMVVLIFVCMEFKLNHDPRGGQL